MARRESWLRLAGLFALAVLPFCWGCPGDQSLSDLPEASPKVDSVRVSPSTIHASPGAVFSLAAVAKGFLGMPVTVPSGTDLTLEWLAPPGVVQDPTANPAIVQVPLSPGTSFTLQARVKRTEMLPGYLVASPAVLSNLVTVYVTPELSADGADPSDWIQVEHIPGNPPAVLLVQAAEGTTEVADWAVGVVGSARLGRNLQAASSATGGSTTETPSSPHATNELAIFAQDRHLELWPPGGPCGTDPAICPWTPSEEHLTANPLKSGGSRYLPIRVGVPDMNALVAGVAIADWASDEVQAAEDRLSRTRAGLKFESLGVFPHKLRDSTTGQPLPVESPTATCEQIDDYIAPNSVREQSEIPIGDEPPPDPHALYVVFVPEILIPPSTGGTAATRLTGYACPPDESPDHPWVGRVVLISMADYNVTTLVHEIGHVLSLNGDLTDLAGGHTNGIPGFARSNLMNNTTSLPYRQARDHLTLGQIYRMNAHPKSWLNTLLPADQLLVRPCPRSSTRGVCPALAADGGG